MKRVFILKDTGFLLSRYIKKLNKKDYIGCSQ